MERRILRRAADQALLTALALRSDMPGPPGGRADRDFEYKPTVPVDIGQVYDHEPRTEPIPAAEPDEVTPPPIDDAPPVGIVEEPAEPVDVYDLVAEHVAETPIVNDPDPVPAPVAQAYVAPQLDFAMAEEPWCRTTPTAVALVAAVVVAVLCAGWLVLRSPSTTTEQSTVEATTSAASAPTSAKPTAASAPMPPPPAPPAPPPPPPPPPPQAEPVYSGPQRQYSPQYREPTPAEKPKVDVTRAPMSVAPVPKPVPGSDHNVPSDTPGQQPRRHGCFGFC